MRQKSIAFFFGLFLLGTMIMLYPLLTSLWNHGKEQNTIQAYQKVVEDKSEEEEEKILQQAKVYNESLTSMGIEDVFSNPDKESSNYYQSILKINEDGVMGYLTIPKIHLKLPIYHGTTNEVLQKGVGHLEGSSFPIGGVSSHAILSAHRGLPSSLLFTNLDQVKEKDYFSVHILNQDLYYQVDQVKVVEPQEVSDLEIQEGKDYITLVTCTPYAVNTQRLLVRGVRVEKSEIDDQMMEAVQKPSVADQDILALIGVVLVVAMTVVIFCVFVIQNHKRKIRVYKEEVINYE